MAIENQNFDHDLLILPCVKVFQAAVVKKIGQENYDAIVVEGFDLGELAPEFRSR